MKKFELQKDDCKTKEIELKKTELKKAEFQKTGLKAGLQKKELKKPKTNAFAKKVFALCCVLCLIFLAPICLLSGCGNKNVSISALAQTFAQLDSENASFTQQGIFRGGVINSQETDFIISYASEENTVERFINSGDQNFVELREVFNKIFAQTANYLQSSARALVLAFDGKAISASAQAAVNSLNGALVEYINFLPTFAYGRQRMIENADFFAQNSNNPQTQYGELRSFKKNYLLPLVQKNQNAASALASAVESTKIFEILQGQIVPEDSQLLADFVQMKLVPLYTRLRLEEISSQMFWQEFSSNHHTQPNFARVSQIFEDAENEFSKILHGFSINQNKTLSKEEIQRVQNLTNLLLQDAKTCFAALDAMDLQNFAQFDGTEAQYFKNNPFANTHLQTIETFWTYTMPKFLESVDFIL